MKDFIKTCDGFETSNYESLEDCIYTVFNKYIQEDDSYIPAISSNAKKKRKKKGASFQRIIAFLCMSKDVVFLL